MTTKELIEKLISNLETRLRELIDLEHETDDEYYTGRIREVQITLNELKEERKWI